MFISKIQADSRWTKQNRAQVRVQKIEWLKVFQKRKVRKTVYNRAFNRRDTSYF